MRSVLHDLQKLVEENKKVLSTPDFEMERLQKWSGQREAIFARLKDMEVHWLPGEEAIAANLVKEILEADRIIIARFKQQLACLEEKIGATQKIRRMLNANARTASPALLQRVA